MWHTLVLYLIFPNISVLVSFYCCDKHYNQKHWREKALFGLHVSSSLMEVKVQTQAGQERGHMN